MQQQLLDLNAAARCMDYMREGSCPGRNDLLVMLLANLTSLEAGAEALLQARGPAGAVGCLLGRLPACLGGFGHCSGWQGVHRLWKQGGVLRRESPGNWPPVLPAAGAGGAGPA